MVTTLPPLPVMTRVRVAALEAELLDVRAGCLGHAQPVEGEQGDEGVLGGRAEPGSDQPDAEFVAVQGGGVRLLVQPGSADVSRRGVLKKLLFDDVLVKTGDGAQPPGDGGAGSAAVFQFAGERLDVRAAGPGRAGHLQVPAMNDACNVRRPRETSYTIRN
jgi:hypothetical protein